MMLTVGQKGIEPRSEKGFSLIGSKASGNLVGVVVRGSDSAGVLI